jgi:hypothetical protein
MSLQSEVRGRRLTGAELIAKRSHVERGAQLLDEAGPHEWREQVNLERLNLALASRCVLGQVFGDYHTGLQVLRIYSGSPYGFCCGLWSVCYCDHLTELWTEQLQRDDVHVELTPTRQLELRRLRLTYHQRGDRYALTGDAADLVTAAPGGSSGDR